MADSVINCSDGGNGNVCVICMQIFNKGKVTILPAELEFLTLVFEACSKFLVSDVFKKCFEWNFIEENSSPVCTDCFSNFEKIFRLSMNLTQIRSEIQLVTDSFTNQIQSLHKKLDLNCDEKDPLDLGDLKTENDSTVVTTSINHPDMLMNPVCDIEIIDFKDIKFEDDENTNETVVIPSTPGVVLIDPLREDISLSDRECSRSCKNIADETIANTIPLKSLKIILKRLEFDSDGKIKSTPPATNPQTSTNKRKAAVVAAKCLQKIIQFEQKGNSKPTSDYSDESSIYNSDSNHDSDSGKSADLDEDDEVQEEGITIQKPNSTITLRTLNIEKVKYLLQQKLQCQSCKSKFNFIRDLKSHSLSSGHSNVPSLSCNYCKKSFYTLYDLKTHKRRFLCQFKFKCKKCPKEFEKQWKLQSHHNRSHTNHRFECKSCKKTFFHKRTFLQHRRSHTKNCYKCQKCKISFPWKILLDQHNRIHDAEEKYICKICHTKYSTQFSLNLHHHLVHAKNVAHKYLNNAKLMIHRIKSYRCSICHERFKSDKQLYLHKDATGHITMKKFRCVRCRMLFYRLIDLNIHKEKHNIPNKNVIYECHLCPAKYRHKESLSNHQLQKHEGQSFTCEVCDETFTTARNFKYHRIMHTFRTFDCEICCAKFRSALTLQNHKKSVHPERLLNFCQHCRKQFENKALYSSHFCGSYNEALYKCNLCNENYNNKSDLNSHSKKCSNNVGKSVEKNGSDSKNGRHECKFCDKTFNHENSLRLHTKSHKNDISGYSCKICGQVYTNMSQLSNHSKIHLSNSPFKCKFCNKIFRSKSGLEYHIDFNHATKVFECQICKKGCGSKKSLDKHFKLHSRKIKNKKLMCEDCGKCFKSMYLLKTHKLTHTTGYKFNCGLCTYNCNGKSGLRLHIKTVHNKPIQFQCTLCGKDNTSSFLLESHMRTHTREKPYKCSICFKQFRTKTQLSQHGNYHTGKKFKCPICDKEFLRKSNLTQHSTTHGEGSFQCDHCGKKCKRKDNLITHMRLHTGEKPFQCQECGNGFTRLDNLNTHLKWHQRSRNKKSEELNQNDVDNTPSEGSSDEDN